jgi:hypothetical protein
MRRYRLDWMNGNDGFSPLRRRMSAGHGGIAAVSCVTRIAASTIGRGLKDLDAPPASTLAGVRRPGGGRKSLNETNPGLLDDLNALVEPDARGDPMSAALDLQEPAPTCGRTRQSRAQGQPHGRR